MNISSIFYRASYLLLTLAMPASFLHSSPAPPTEMETPEEKDPYDLSITNHTIHLESGPLSYTAITGMCPIYGESKKEAHLFFVSFSKDNEDNRPITFVFPGGPGGAGTIESILTFGPRRLLTAAEGRTIHPPYRIIDNPQTLLEYTDLVFVDPVECGFSRLEEAADPRSYFSLEGDLEILGEFIHTYINVSERWNSPIYLSGTSYGTLRCCGLANHLFKYGIPIKGIILSGCAFDFSTLDSQRDKWMPDWLLLPTFAATAWYHKRLWPEKPLEEVVDYARRFTYDELTPYMLQPGRLSCVEKLELEKKFAELSGLSIDTVRQYNLRINETIYASEFFRPARKILGRLDTRYAGEIACINPFHAHDPSYLDSLGSIPAFHHYLQTELNTRFPMRKYIGFSIDVLRSWNYWTYDSHGEPNLLQRLRQAMIINPLMKVFVGSGYYDCRTPFAAAEFCFEHLDLPASYIKNIQFEYYEAGHGPIFDYPSLTKWKKDLIGFYGRQ